MVCEKSARGEKKFCGNSEDFVKNPAAVLVEKTRADLCGGKAPKEECG